MLGFGYGFEKIERRQRVFYALAIPFIHFSNPRSYLKYTPAYSCPE
jgi:hypothetical protein